MKKTILLFFLIVIGWSCGLLKDNSSATFTKEQLVGVWGEHWIKSNVTYVDTLRIFLAGNGEIKVRCVNRPSYRYDKVYLKDGRFTFKMQNGTDGDEPFLIDYTFTRLRERELSGESLNSKGAKNKVKLKRIK
jgi:hypothetical protein